MGSQQPKKVMATFAQLYNPHGSLQIPRAPPLHPFTLALPEYISRGRERVTSQPQATQANFYPDIIYFTGAGRATIRSDGDGTSGSTSFEVWRREAELVRPARPTPREYNRLSDIDDQEALRFQVPFIQFYRGNRTGRDPAWAIREGLARALVFY
ncbi:uncharacterized protein J3R85_017667 [Psidium guajava]|nr:uncharacterized protein J3R85_017667 [Psidium guajava]